MFAWVNGTALGAFSEPLVNSTTAGWSVLISGTRLCTLPGLSRTVSRAH